jgi:type IV pilus assembly protein PilA
MTCSRCGATIGDQSQFCPRCGASLSESAPGITPPVQPGSLPGAATPGQPPLGEALTDGKAVASLVFGILSLTGLSLLAGIPAIILGHLSRSRIRQSMGRLKGSGMAMAGLIMGYISSSAIPILIIAAIAIPNLLRARMAANSSAAAMTVRTLNADEVAYLTSYPSDGYAPDLATLGPGSSASCPDGPSSKHACLIHDSVLANPSCTGASWCIKGAYQYNVQSPERAAPFTDYVISAVPVNAASGSKGFCSSSDAVLRFENLTRPRSSPYSQRECAALTPQ